MFSWSRWLGGGEGGRRGKAGRTYGWLVHSGYSRIIFSLCVCEGVDDGVVVVVRSRGWGLSHNCVVSMYCFWLPSYCLPACGGGRFFFARAALLQQQVVRQPTPAIRSS